jgi:hypothetical protein
MIENGDVFDEDELRAIADDDDGSSVARDGGDNDAPRNDHDDDDSSSDDDDDDDDGGFLESWFEEERKKAQCVVADVATSRRVGESRDDAIDDIKVMDYAAAVNDEDENDDVAVDVDGGMRTGDTIVVRLGGSALRWISRATENGGGGSDLSAMGSELPSSRCDESRFVGVVVTNVNGAMERSRTGGCGAVAGSADVAFVGSPATTGTTRSALVDCIVRYDGNMGRHVLDVVESPTTRDRRLMLSSMSSSSSSSIVGPSSAERMGRKKRRASNDDAAAAAPAARASRDGGALGGGIPSTMETTFDPRTSARRADFQIRKLLRAGGGKPAAPSKTIRK